MDRVQPPSRWWPQRSLRSRSEPKSLQHILHKEMQAFHEQTPRDLEGGGTLCLQEGKRTGLQRSGRLHLPRLRPKPHHTSTCLYPTCETHLLNRTVFIPQLGWKEREIERQTDSTGIWQMPGVPLLLDARGACWFISKDLGCCLPSHCGKRRKTYMQPAQLLSPDTCHEQVPRETGGWIAAAPTQGVGCQV